MTSWRGARTAGCWIDPYEAFRKRDLCMPRLPRHRATDECRCGTSGHLPDASLIVYPRCRRVLTAARLTTPRSPGSRATQRIAAVVLETVEMQDAKIHPLVHGCQGVL